MEFNATFLATAISFIIFVFIMNVIFYKPLEKVVNERKKFIDDNYNEAKQNNEKSSTLIQDRAEKLTKANSEGKKLINEKTDKTKQEKTSLITNSQQKAKDEIQKAKDELNKNANEAKKALKTNIIDLAKQISIKVLKGKIEPKNVDENKINELMKEN